MNTFHVGRFTFTRNTEGEVLLEIPMAPLGDGTAMKAERVIELTSFLLGDTMDIFQMYLASEMIQAHKESGEAEVVAVRDYNSVVIDACEGLKTCEVCKVVVPVDLKKQARKVRELNKLLFEEIRDRVEKGELVYAQVQKSTGIIITAMVGIEDLCGECQAQFQERTKKAFFRIRRNSGYKESKGGNQV